MEKKKISPLGVNIILLSEWVSDCCLTPKPWVGIFYSASPLKQQSADLHVALLEHIILIPSQPVFALSP